MKIKSQKQGLCKLACLASQTSLKQLMFFCSAWMLLLPFQNVQAQCPMICNDLVNVTLNSTGTAMVMASVFDEGTTAGCCINYFEVKREGQPDSAFGPFVIFDCDDVGTGLVNVVVRGVACNGGSSTCNSQAFIEDRIDPVVICPLPVVIGCGPGASSPSVTGQPEVTEACSVASLTYTDNSFSGNCGSGYIERVWAAVDNSGNAGTCTHILNIEDTTPLQIDFPNDFTAVACVTAEDLDPEDLPAPFNFPVINGEDCELVFQNYDDIVFTASGNSCLKILRTWTIIDWCVYNPGSTNGLYEDIQIIKVNDNEPPTYDCPEDFTVAFLDADCDTDINLPMPTDIDDCLPDVDVYVSGGLGTGFDFEDVEEGVYDFTYTLADGCGNASSCTISVTVQDGNAPDFVCLNGLSVSLMPSGMISIEADVFIQSISDNCTATNDIVLRLGGEPEGGQDDPPSSDALLFDCEDLGQNIVAVWAGDEAGNWDYCLTYIVIQDNFETCASDDIISVGGRVESEEGDDLENIMVHLSFEEDGVAIMTDSVGDYMFDEIYPGETYTIKPGKDTLHTQGVNILDLLLLRYHILQIQPLESPYKIIAADIDNSGDISIVDAIHLHKLILSIVDTFPNNESWRFVRTNYTFPDALNPFDPPFPEFIEIDSMTSSMIDADFTGIKIGDLNGDVLGNTLQTVEDRNSLSLYSIDQKMETGIAKIPIRSNQKGVIFGLQTGFQVKRSNIDWMTLEAGSLDIDQEDWIVNDHDELSLVWTNEDGLTVEKDEILFYLVLEMDHAAMASEVFDMEGETLAIMANIQNGVDVSFIFDQSVVKNKLTIGDAFPNPFREQVILPFQISVEGPVNLRVWDSTGKLVYQIEADFSEGLHQWQLDGKDLADNGTYWYEISIQNHSERGKIIYLMD